MDLNGDIRRFRLARLAGPVNAVLLLLVMSLVFHWGLASSLASTNEAPRANVELERITPVEAENHLALVRSGAPIVALSMFDQRLPSASASPDDNGGDWVKPPVLKTFLNAYTAAKVLHCEAPFRSPQKAFQARAPPAIF